MKKFIIGVDGGGTKTHAVFLSLQGEILGQVTVGPSNYQQAGKKGIQDVCSAILEALPQQNLATEGIARWVLGLAGAGRPSDQLAVREAVEALGFAGRVTVENDGFIALVGAFSGEPGIILISGTGSICYGMNAEEKMARSGGWGYLLGDEGSGYFIGNQALIAALKDLDGRGAQTVLRQKFESFYGIASIDLIVPKIYAGSIRKEDVASLAPFVFEAAERGDSVAEQIVARAGTELGKMAIAVARQLGLDNQPIRVAPIGSVLQNQQQKLVPFISAELKAVSSNLQFQQPQYPPAVGAALVGLKKEGIPLTLEILENVATSFSQ